ncbi:MAG TPA: response regulator transcription factor [Stellaceae bacterium]|nr:response regulator transcription factor [Stellaceae bacterium]
MTESGHTVEGVADGSTALAMAQEGIYDAVILDRKLPGLDGLAIVRRIRRRDQRTPILMLSGVATTGDRVDGLQAGCDDYLAKPYSFIELLARLEALGRRAGPPQASGALRVGDLQLDTLGRSVSRGGRPIELGRREFLMLQHLMQHAGEVVTRSMLLEAAWTYDAEPRGNVVDMHIYRLRRKIDDGFSCRLLHTVPGAGYMIQEPKNSEPQQHV